MTTAAEQPEHVIEPATETRVLRRADVVVVGGGPAGVGAAVAAARAGADTVLVERYGHLGGMATGGLVILIPHLSGDDGERHISGICQEWIDRLDRLDGVIHPDYPDIGSGDAAVTARWRNYFSFVVNDRIRHGAYVDPELLKCALNDMVNEAGVKLYLHSWGCRALCEDGRVRGVVFESKAGRRALLGDVIIDTTGDGDIMASAGAAYEGGYDSELRSSMLAVVFRLGNVDFARFCDFREREPDAWKAVTSRIHELGGFRMLPFPTNRNDVMWVNNWVPNRSCLDIEDLTWTEVEVRRTMRGMRAILQREVPGFEHCFILDTASQLGTRGSRRLTGEYRVTLKDVSSGREFEDTITWFPSLQPTERPVIQLPYRSLVPERIDGLLVAGRCFSSDAPANNLTNLIPHCVAMGEAAGTAAALAVDHGIRPRDLDHRELQAMLRRAGVNLPTTATAGG